jgi:UDP-N-acetylglucosamine 4,6-dehydratase
MLDIKKMFKNKIVLITGGTGFLGRALVKEISKYSPQSIRVFSRDELKHHEMQEKMGKDYPKEIIRHLIGDVRDYERLRKAAKGADIVIHAAALKRIDMIEYNVEEAIKTNVIGSLNVARVCVDNNVEKAIFVSTDKACSPINTYGACKFLGERIFLESNYSKGSARTKFIAVRYGNVIESTGSVIPFFVDRIKNNQTIPLTDEQMTRFLITPEQAVKLVMNSILYGEGGEVFVPQLPAARMSDLIWALKEIIGLSPPVIIMGLRPGEKIHEIMVNKSEVSRTYNFNGMYVIAPLIKRVKPWDKQIKELWKKGINIQHKFDEYNSKDCCVDKEIIKRILMPIIKI